MNKYFYNAILMIFSLLPANLFSMRSANISKPLQGTKQRFSTNNSSAQSQPNTTVSIPVNSSNQALAKVINEQKQEQGSSKKSKWYQSKNFQNTMPFLTPIGLLKLEILINSDDAETSDPELHAVFLKIKKDMGITENIPLRISKPGAIINNGAIAYYHALFNLIMIDPQFYKNSHPSNVIKTLAHELEHARQFLGYVGSYQASTLNDVISRLQGKHSKIGHRLKVETGADASAAGYFDCHDCLKIVRGSGQKYNPSNLASGYFTTDQGYFAPQDYDSYIERACREGEPCKAHQILNIDKKTNFSKFFTYDPLNFPKEPSSVDKYLYDRIVKKETPTFSKLFPLNFYLPKSAE